jgi:hypothetical protein
MSKKRVKRRSPSSKVRRKREPVDEAAAKEFVDSLREHGQLHEGRGPLPPGATHVARKKRTARGEKIVIERKRFSFL